MADADPNSTSLVDSGSSHAVPPSTNGSGTRANILAVLDLNGTLLDRVTKRRKSETKNRNPKSPTSEFSLNSNPIYLRPYLLPFLEFLFANFHVAVWTSATVKNARAMVEGAVPPHLVSKLEFVWDRSKCDLVGSAEDHESRKDLDKIWKAHRRWKEQNTFILDDTSNKHLFNPSNAILLPSYDVLDCPEGIREEDNVLPRVANYLRDLRAWSDVKSANGESADVREWIGGTPFDALTRQAHDDPSFSSPLSTLPTNLFLDHAITTDDRGRVLRKSRIVGRPDRVLDPEDAERIAREREEAKKKAKTEKNTRRRQRKTAGMLVGAQQIGDSGMVVNGESAEGANGEAGPTDSPPVPGAQATAAVDAQAPKTSRRGGKREKGKGKGASSGTGSEVVMGGVGLAAAVGSEVRNMDVVESGQAEANVAHVAHSAGSTSLTPAGPQGGTRKERKRERDSRRLAEWEAKRAGEIVQQVHTRENVTGAESGLNESTRSQPQAAPKLSRMQRRALRRLKQAAMVQGGSVQNGVTAGNNVVEVGSGVTPDEQDAKRKKTEGEDDGRDAKRRKTDDSEFGDA